MWARALLVMTLLFAGLIAAAVAVESSTLGLLALLGAAAAGSGLLALGLAMLVHRAWTRGRPSARV